MPNNDDNNNNGNDPTNATSRLSSKARLAYYLTGGRRRGPTTMASLLKLTRDRNDVKKGHKAWAAASKADLNRYQGQWGQSGLAGKLEDARGAGPKPRGMALVRWYRGNGGEADGRPKQVAREQPPEDIYGASDEEEARRIGAENGGGAGHEGAEQTSNSST